MKNSTKIFLAFGLWLLAIGSLSAQYTTLNALPVCWTTGGGVDSSLYLTQTDASQRTFPSRLYYYNVQGQAVSVVGGTLKWGHCNNPTTDSLTIRLDSLRINVQVQFDSLAFLLDSLINTTKEPQVCDCSYVLDLDNHDYTIQTNQQYPTWSFDRFVTRDCGAGAEEIFRQSGNVVASGTNKSRVFYETPGSDYLSNGGYLDSMRVYSKNPDETFWVYLSPQKVWDNYPNLISTGFDTTDLRFYTTTVADMMTAVDAVVRYAVDNWAATHSPSLSTPLMDFESTILTTGKTTLKWYVYHNPTSTYIAVNPQAAARRLDYHKNNSTAVSTTGAGHSGISMAITQGYNLPCDTTIFVSYGDIVTNDTVAWYQVLLDYNAAPTLGSLGEGSCTQACPESGDCVQICNTQENPIPVQVVSTCNVQNIVEFPVTASSNSVTLPSNYYHSVTIAVTSGTVSISLVNSGSVATQTFSSGQTFSVKAAECELLKTGFGINATSGAAIVSTIR